MTPRPCTRPDGGCGEPIIEVTTIAGRKQVLNPKPVNGVVMVNAEDTLVLSGRGDSWPDVRSRVVPVYVDHHATCATWLTRIKRERAAEAGGR
jgi:hypothetical protein